MRSLLGLLLAPVLLASTLVLAGCGDDPGDTQVDGTPTGASSSAAPENGPVEPADVVVVTQTDAGGDVSEQAVDLSDADAEADFLAQFDGDAMATAIDQQTAGLEVGDDQTMVAAVVSIGCVPPTDVTLERTDAGLMMTAVPSKEDGNVECFAAATHVAVAVVDAAAV